MVRLVKILSFAGLASVYVMQLGLCTFKHGVSFLPNIGNTLNIGNPFAGLLGGLGL